jgi:hypothetical protein
VKGTRIIAVLIVAVLIVVGCGNVDISTADGGACDAGACSTTSDCPVSDPCIVARCHGSDTPGPAPLGCCVYVVAHGNGCP